MADTIHSRNVANRAANVQVKRIQRIIFLAASLILLQCSPADINNVADPFSEDFAVYNLLRCFSGQCSPAPGEPAILIQPTGGSVNVVEGGTTDSYTIVLNSEPTADVTIDLTADAQVEISGGSCGLPSANCQLVFTAANFNTVQTITVQAVDDGASEGAHTGTINHTATSSDSDYDVIPIADIVANITDNDSPAISLVESGGNTAATEGGTTDTYTLVLMTAPTNDVTITVNADAQTRVNGGSCGAPAASCVFTFTTANWNVTQTVTVSALDDSIVEGPHTGSITHSVSSADANYNAIPVGAVSVAITDNDSAAVNLTESGGNTTATEGGAGDTYTLVLTSEPTANVTVTVNADAQTRINGGSCGAPAASCTFTFTNANWNVVQTVTVSAFDDSIAEGAHSGTISHTVASTDANYNAIPVGAVSVAITDNDSAAANLTESGGNTTATEGGAGDTYTLVLTSEPTANVTVTVNADAQTRINGGSCGAPAASCTFTFTPANWNITQTVTVSAFNDSIAEGAHSGTISHTVASTDANYNAIPVGAVSVAITDNDSAAVNLTESGGNTTATEGGAGDTYTLVLTSEPTANVTVTVNADAQTRINGGSCGAPAASCTFTFTPANWNITQTVTVSAFNDSIAEGAHSGTITHTVASTDGDYNAFAVGDVTVSITDNDTAGITLTESGGSTDVAESGTTDTYTVVLTSEPLSNVTIRVTAEAQTRVNGGSCGAPASDCDFVFTSANWNVAQTVTVSAFDDAVFEGAHTSNTSHVVTAADPNYNAFAIPNVSINITDNDFTVTAVAAQNVSSHSCALLNDGSVRCWGRNLFGELGYGNTNHIGDDENPNTAGPVNVGGTVIQLAVGDRHTCALLTGGTVRCWGEGSFGRLGYGNTNTIGDNETPASAGDVNVGGTVTQIAVGGSHTCALLDTQQVVCWGNNSSGQLGYGNTTVIGDDETPDTAGTVDVGGNVVEITAGFSHTCARLDTGTVRCWGDGNSGRLGYGNTNIIGDDETPATAGDVNVGDTVTQITAGRLHTCARLTSGGIRCWGNGADGRLGYGTFTFYGDDEDPAIAPIINLPANAAQVVAGGNHTCALLVDDSVYCWGDGSNGQLGYGNLDDIGDNENPDTAGPVNTGVTATSVAAGFDHTCVISSTGLVKCWGKGQFGRLGQANENNIGDDETPDTIPMIQLF